MKKNIVESKSLGIPLREDVARKVDDLMKSLPKECRNLRRKGTLPDASNGEMIPGERADISMVSVESVDREGDVILAKGMALEFFQLNPVVTFAHKYDELPVGKAAWIRRVANGIKAKTIYSEATETARACWAMTQEGILKGKSIGFLPTVIRSPTQQEVSMNPTWKNAGAVIESAILLEYAVAPIPCNQDALVQAVSKGLADRKTLVRLGLAQPEKKLTAEQIARVITREFDRQAKTLTPEMIIKAALDKYRA